MRQETHESNQRNHRILTADRESIEGELSRTRNDLAEQLATIRAGFQLDISLERKKLEEQAIAFEAKAKEVEEYSKVRMNEMGRKLSDLYDTTIKGIIGITHTPPSDHNRIWAEHSWTLCPLQVYLALSIHQIKVATSTEYIRESPPTAGARDSSI
jgi:hypothetical protein